MDLGRRLVAELVGTFWLVLGGCGAAVLAATFSADTDGPFVGIGLVGVSLAFGLVTPPYGLCLLIASAIGEIRMVQALRDVAGVAALALHLRHVQRVDVGEGHAPDAFSGHRCVVSRRVVGQRAGRVEVVRTVRRSRRSTSATRPAASGTSSRLPTSIGRRNGRPAT